MSNLPVSHSYTADDIQVLEGWKRFVNGRGCILDRRRSEDYII